MKKFIYGILIFVVSLVLLIVVAANSSYVIKKVVDMVAPDYNITYSDITGNVFTGVQIDGLKFADMNISSEVRFSWNPSKILYKHIAIREVTIDDIDVETVKALIASLPSSDDNTSSDPFPLVITVGKVHVSVTPFTEEGIHFQKSVLDARDLSYAVDDIEVGDLTLELDTNVTNIRLHAALKEGTLDVETLEVAHIDSEAFERMFVPSDSEDNTGTEKKKPEQENKTLNPLIPKVVKVHHFDATLKPRRYMDASVDLLHVKIDDLLADIVKIAENKQGALHIGNYLLNLQSDVGQVTVEGKLSDDTVILEDVSVVKVDTLALKAMFMPDHNESNMSVDDNASGMITGDTEMTAEATSEKKREETNALIPKKVIINKLHTDILPAIYKPVHIHHFALDGKNVVVDIARRIIEKGELDLNGTTNLSNFKEHSIIRNNHLDGHIVLTPNQHLFDLYKLPLRKKAIGDIAIDFTASKEKLTVDMNAKAHHILVIPEAHPLAESNVSDANVTVAGANVSENNTTQPFNIDINRLELHASYLIDQKKADAHVSVNVTTPYAKESTLKADFRMDGETISYQGALKAGTIEGIDAKLLQPLHGLEVLFKGDEKTLSTTIDSQGLKGYFNVPDFTQSGTFHLETKAPVAVGEMVTLPAELNATKVSAVVDVPLNFKQLTPIKGKAAIRSNIANMDADLVYGKETHLKVVSIIPQESLLREFNDKVRWNAISPLTLDVSMEEKEISAVAKSSKISATLNMDPYEGKVLGKVRLAGMTTTLDGTVPGNIVIKSDVGSFRTLMGTVKTFYEMENVPKLDGKLDLYLIVSEQREVYLSLLSPQIIYQSDRTTTHVIDDVSMILRKSGGNIELSSYHVIYNDMTFYSSKPSVVDINKEMITIPQFWLNDQLKVTGKVNAKTMQGKIEAKAPTFHFSHPMIDLDSKIDITTILEGKRTDIKGKVTLLGGDVHYDLSTKTFPSDSDIVIVQDMKQENNSTFMDNLTMLINVDSKKPLEYKEGPVNVKANVELGIHKALYSDPMIIGSVDIVDGSSYNFQGKVFKLEHSHIYFTGDPTKPLLDLTVKYKAMKHMITIIITGTPTMPNIIFSSVPSLSREQILSLILFDSEEVAGTNNANDMMKMMGGAMAKSALNDLGVKIDHLVIGEGNSVEVGKKIGEKTTVIYINGEIPKMEVKYEYSPTVEVVVGASEQSESVDVVYRKDFNLKDEDDIVIKGR